MKKKVIYFSAILIVLLLSACGGGSDDPAIDKTAQLNEKGVVSGFVTDSGNGERLADVKVSADNKSTTTNSNGEFILTNLQNKDYVIRFEKKDFSPGYKNVTVVDSSETLLLSLKKEGKRQNYDSTTTATISESTTNGPYAVIFEPGVFDSTDNNLKVSITPLDPTIESDVLPGQLETDTVMLVPLTFADYTIYDSSGNKVNLLDGKEAIVELPIPLSLRNLPEYALGKIIHCYSYNPVTGQWEDFVVGTVVISSIDNSTPVVRASIKHFSWYGAAPESGECVDIYGQVISSNTGLPLAFARVEAFPGSMTTSDANGYFRIATAAFGSPKITASRSFVGSDGVRAIEYGLAVDVSLAGLITRPCSSPAGSNPSNGSSNSPGSESNPLILTIGDIGQLSYEAFAILSEDSLTVFLNTNILGLEDVGDIVTGANITLSGPDGDIAVTEPFMGLGVYTIELVTKPGQRYTLKIDADNNGSIDGSGSVYMPGDIEFTNPITDSMVSSENLTVSWTDSAYQSTSINPGYSANYWVSLSGSNDTPPFSFDASFYLGSNLSFVPKSIINVGDDLLPGNYSAAISSISGAYLPSLSNSSASIVNNITGPSITGQFYVYGTSSETIEFVITEN